MVHDEYKEAIVPMTTNQIKQLYDKGWERIDIVDEILRDDATMDRGTAEDVYQDVILQLQKMPVGRK
jgi:hypothetical protein